MSKFLYVGNFRAPFCTEVHLARTLEKLGHEVERWQEDERRSQELTNRINQSTSRPFDYFLFTRTWGGLVTMEHLAQLAMSGIASISYHLDLYVGLKREDGLAADPFWRTDYVFTPDGDPRSQQVFNSYGINHYYMKPGVFEEECYALDLPKTRDSIFVGSYYYHPEWAYRQQLIDHLKTLQGFELISPNFGQTVRGADLNRLYASTKVVVGDSLCKDFTHTYYWSDRVYETIGRGGFIIHPKIAGMEEEFTDGKDIVFYDFGDFEQLDEKIAYYVSHDDERERIRRAGFELVKTKCTYTNRLQQMMEVISA